MLLVREGVDSVADEQGEQRPAKILEGKLARQTYRRNGQTD